MRNSRLSLHISLMKLVSIQKYDKNSIETYHLSARVGLGVKFHRTHKMTRAKNNNIGTTHRNVGPATLHVLPDKKTCRPTNTPTPASTIPTPPYQLKHVNNQHRLPNPSTPDPSQQLQGKPSLTSKPKKP